MGLRLISRAKALQTPVGTFWSAAEMLAWLGEESASEQLMECVENVTERGIMTLDLGGSSTTKEVTQRLLAGNKTAQKARRQEYVKGSPSTPFQFKICIVAVGPRGNNPVTSFEELKHIN